MVTIQPAPGTTSIGRLYASSFLSGVTDSLIEAPEGGAKVLPLQRVPSEEVRPFVNAVAVYDLQVAAGQLYRQAATNNCLGTDRP